MENKNRKRSAEGEGTCMKEKKQSELAVLLGYAGSYKKLTFLGLGLSAIAMILASRGISSPFKPSG